MGSPERCPSHSRSELSKQAPPPPSARSRRDIHRPGKRSWPSSAGNWPGARQDCQRSPSFFLGVLAMARFLLCVLMPLSLCCSTPHASLRIPGTATLSSRLARGTATLLHSTQCQSLCPAPQAAPAPTASRPCLPAFHVGPDCRPRGALPREQWHSPSSWLLDTFWALPWLLFPPLYFPRPEEG